MKNLSGTIFDIKKYALHDGPGIRTTVFLQGCPLRCEWCHNPEGQANQPVLLYRSNRCVVCGSCVEVCPQGGIALPLSEQQGIELRESGVKGLGVWGVVVTDRSKCSACGACAQVCYYGAREISGRQVSVGEIMVEIERDVPFYDQSGGGVTFSGGEPLLQPQFLSELLRACKQREIHTVVDTSGYAPWEALNSIRGEVDLFLYDLKLMDDERHQQVTGVSSALILNNLQRLAESGQRIEIRIPLIPGINDDAKNLRQTAAFIAGLPNITHVALLPYHDIAAAKYAALGRVFPLPDTAPPDEAAMRAATRYFEGVGLSVKIS